MECTGAGFIPKARRAGPRIVDMDGRVCILGQQSQGLLDAADDRVLPGIDRYDKRRTTFC